MNNKPIAWMDKLNTIVLDKDYQQFPKELQNGMIPLYTHPAELTDEEILTIADYYGICEVSEVVIEFAKAILRKAQEK